MGNFFKNFLKVLGIVVVVAIIIGLVYIFDLFKNEQLPVIKDQEDQSILNVLLIGADQGIEGVPRPDTILLISADLKDKGVGILSLPRDTRVDVPGYKNKYKLNSSFVLGGIDLFKQVVENLTGAPIHCYIKVDFQGFESLVDTLGGIEIDVADRMHYKDEAGGLYIDIKPGLQILDGKQALDFVRYREPIKADIGRIERQQQFLKAVFDKVFSVKMITKIPALISEVKNLVDTDLSFKDIARLTKMAGEFPRERIEMATLPGVAEYINNASYWLPDEARVDRMILSLIYTKDFVENAKYKVTIYNGSGLKGLAAEKADILEDWGFKIVEIANADNFDHQFTSIYYGDDSLEGAMRISSILGGAPERDIKITGKTINIILGKDQFPK